MYQSLHKCLNISKGIAFATSLIWLLLVVKYLEIRPDYTSRNYLKSFQDIPKNNGIFHMSTVNMPETNTKSKDDDRYFNFLQLNQNKRTNCDTHLHVLVVNANSKQTGQSYFSIYKQIEKYSQNCKYEIYQLSHKEHILMNSQYLMREYAKEIAQAIEYLNSIKDTNNLLVVTFEEGCTLVLKSLELLSAENIRNLSGFIFINAYNQNIRILYQTPCKYIKNVQMNLLKDHQKMKVLNKTRLIFISTLSYFDNITYNQYEEQKFNFIWQGKKLQNTIFLSTRFMRNIFTLIHEKDYFGYSSFPNRLAQFMIEDAYQPMSIELIQYYFYFGEIYINPDYPVGKKDNCTQIFAPVQKNKVNSEKVLCLTFNFTHLLHHNNESLMIITSKKANLYNNRNQKIDSMFEITNCTFYYIEQARITKTITVYNPYPQQIVYQFVNAWDPISNPLNQTFFTNFKFNSTILTNRMGYKSIKTCPYGSILIYPFHYVHFLLGESDLNIIFFQLLKIKLDYYQQAFSKKTDCYPDFTTQFHILPKKLLVQWQFFRNLFFLISIFSYLRADSIYSKFYFYLCIAITFSWLAFNEIILILNIFLVTAAVWLEKLINIALFLASFVQEIFDIKYCKFMLAVTLAMALLKDIGNNFEEFYHLSAWKVLCISLIFVINRYNILVLLFKLYFLYQNIIYNHDDLFEIATVLGWIYLGLNQQYMQNVKNLPSLSQQYKNTKLQMVLIVGFSLFVRSPSYMLNYILNAYIIGKVIYTAFKKSYSTKLL